MKAIGIDVGGTGLKAAVVDLEEGAIVGERLRQPTPQPATREALSAEIAALVSELDSAGSLAIGVGFPAIVVEGVALTSGNVEVEWMYADIHSSLSEVLQRATFVLNDGDAAGLAELHYGAARNVDGTVVMVTLGTGIGTSLFVNRKLIPNIELGGLAVRGKAAGERASNSVRERRRLSWKRWAKDVELFLRALDLATSPSLIIVGGGVSEDSHEFLPSVSARPPIVPAALRNDAGIIGAAAFAAARDIQKRGLEAGRLGEVIASLEMVPPR